VASLPDDEALRLLNESLAIRGDQPPIGTNGHAGPVRVPR
jgi:hypothetical protein